MLKKLLRKRKQRERREKFSHRLIAVVERSIEEGGKTIIIRESGMTIKIKVTVDDYYLMQKAKHD